MIFLFVYSFFYFCNLKNALLDNKLTKLNPIKRDAVNEKEKYNLLFNSEQWWYK